MTTNATAALLLEPGGRPGTENPIHLEQTVNHTDPTAAVTDARDRLRGMALSLATGTGPLVDPQSFAAAIDAYGDAVRAAVSAVVSPPTSRAELRDRIAEALTAKAYECDGKCGLSERECYDAHPIRFSAMAGGTTHVDGSVTAIADAVLAVLPPPADQAAVEAERDSLGREADRLRKDWVEMRTRAERAEAKVADYENQITWHTTCASCARILDSAIRETERRERAEAELRRLAAEAQQQRGTEAPHSCHNCSGIDPDTCLMNPDRPAPAPRQPAADEEHVCKPGTGLYWCPTSGQTESDCHGGFDVCCDRPDLHRPIAVQQPAAADGEETHRG